MSRPEHPPARTNASKRLAVIAALDDPANAGQSEHYIAGLCGVSRSLVYIVRRERAGKPPSPSRRKKGGRT